MKDFFTQQCTTDKTKGEIEDSDKGLPCKETLDFLKQFARVYRAERSVKPQSLCGFIVN